MKALGIIAMILSIVAIFIPVVGPYLTLVCALLAAFSAGPGLTFGAVAIGLSIINIVLLSPILWIGAGALDVLKGGHSFVASTGVLLLGAQIVAAITVVSIHFAIRKKVLAEGAPGTSGKSNKAWLWGILGAVISVVILAISLVMLVRPSQKKPEEAVADAKASAGQPAVVAAPEISSSSIKGQFGTVAVTNADLGVKLVVDGKPVNDSAGKAVENDLIELVKYFALPEKDVFIIYSNCSGNLCGQTGRYRVLTLQAGKQSVSGEFGDGRNNATIQNDGDKIVVGFGAKGMAVVEPNGIHLSSKQLLE